MNSSRPWLMLSLSFTSIWRVKNGSSLELLCGQSLHISSWAILPPNTFWRNCSWGVPLMLYSILSRYRFRYSSTSFYSLVWGTLPSTSLLAWKKLVVSALSRSECNKFPNRILLWCNKLSESWFGSYLMSSDSSISLRMWGLMNSCYYSEFM